MTICTTLLLMVYPKVTGVEDAGCKCKTCCLDWDDSRIVSHQPNGGVKPISKFTHDLILSITEPIPKSHRMYPPAQYLVKLSSDSVDFEHFGGGDELMSADLMRFTPARRRLPNDMMSQKYSRVIDLRMFLLEKGRLAHADYVNLMTDARPSL